MRTSLSLVVLTAVLFSCSPPPPGDEPLPTDPLERDAGALVPDAGLAATEPDAGTPVDAGLSVDAGASVDAGPVVDAGLPADAGAATPPLDTTPPRVTVTARLLPTLIHVSGTVADLESGAASLELRLNGGTAMSVPFLDGGYDVSLPLRAGRAEYTVEAIARDHASNVATAQATVDGEAPAITLLSQDGVCTSTGCTGAVLDATTSTFTLTATVTEGLGLAAQNPVRVRVLDGTTELVAWSNLTRQPSGEWAWTWSTLPDLDFTRVTFEVEAIDAANNRGTARLQALLDRARPALQFSPSADASCTATACTGTVLHVNVPTLGLTGTVSADATVQVSVRDGASVVLPAQPATPSSGAWSFTWSTIPNLDGQRLTVVVTATDALLNSTTRELIVYVDRVLPSLAVTSPTPSALVGTAKVNITGTALDGSGAVRVELATSPQGPFVAATPDASGRYSGQLDVPMVDAVEQAITVRATDLAGNAQSVTARYVADRVAPVLTINGSDYDCSGPGFCTGSVVMGASIRHNYGGSVTDGSAVTVQRTLVGPSGVVASSSAPATNDTWSWIWTTFPQGVDGAVYELRAIATDAAGNTSAQLTRRTWVDTVAPTVTFPVNGQRNVPLDASLVVFSEPMNAATVFSALSLNPASSPTFVASQDARSFKATQLSGYTPYTLTLGFAQDKAGNLSQPGSASFLTAVTTRPNHSVLPATSAWQPRAPRIAVDQDGRVSIAMTVSSRARVLKDRGDGLFDVLTNFGTVADFEVPTELTLSRQVRGVDQRLAVELQLGVIHTVGGASTLRRVTLSDGQPNGYETLGAVPSTSLATATRIRPVFEQVPYFDLLTRRVQFSGAVVAPNNGATAMTWWNEAQGSWSTGATAALTSLEAFDGRASVEGLTLVQDRVRFWDFDSVSLVATDSFVRSVTAQPAHKTASTTGPTQAASSSYVAWTRDSDLSIACSAAPFVATPAWKSTRVTAPAARLTDTPLASAMSATRFVVAGEYGGQVIVYSTSLTDCSAAPVVTEVGRIPNAREPGVTIDANGKVWVAWLNTDGAIGLSQF